MIDPPAPSGLSKHVSHLLLRFTRHTYKDYKQQQMEAFIAYFFDLTVYGSYFLTCPINNGPLVQYAVT